MVSKEQEWDRRNDELSDSKKISAVCLQFSGVFKGGSVCKQFQCKYLTRASRRTKGSNDLQVQLLGIWRSSAPNIAPCDPSFQSVRSRCPSWRDHGSVRWSRKMCWKCPSPARRGEHRPCDFPRLLDLSIELHRGSTRKSPSLSMLTPHSLFLLTFIFPNSLPLTGYWLHVFFVWYVAFYSWIFTFSLLTCGTAILLSRACQCRCGKSIYQSLLYSSNWVPRCLLPITVCALCIFPYIFH